MDISKIKIAWSYLTGGMGKVTDYLLDVLNSALSKMDGTNKLKVQGVLNLALKILSTLACLKWLVPTKWQSAFELTITAVDSVCDSLEDLALTKKELERVQADFSSAVAAWKLPDDATCQDCQDLAVED